MNILEKVNKYLGENVNKDIDKKSTNEKHGYMDDVIKEFVQKKKVEINKWKLAVEPMVGTYYWYRKDANYEVYATPFREGDNGLPISVVSTEDGSFTKTKIHKMKLTGVEKTDANTYINMMKKILPVNPSDIESDFGKTIKYIAAIMTSTITISKIVNPFFIIFPFTKGFFVMVW